MTAQPGPAELRSRYIAARRITGVLRIVASVAVLAAILTQIIDEVVNDEFVPSEYFSYFTIQSSILNIVVLMAGGILAVRLRAESTRFTSVRMAMVAYAIVTGVVYEALLRNIPPEGFVGIPWPNEVLHVAIPIFVAVDWALAPGRPPLPWRSLWVAIGYPIAWLAFTIVRGLTTGWFPYPFLEPFGPGGWGSVIAYILGISCFVIAIAATAIGMSRVLGRRRRVS